MSFGLHVVTNVKKTLRGGEKKPPVKWQSRSWRKKHVSYLNKINNKKKRNFMRS